MEKIKVGVDIGTKLNNNRGVARYTRNVLSHIGQIADPDSMGFTILHYPNHAPDNTLGLRSARLQPIPLSDDAPPEVRIYQEQTVYPNFQRELDLDVIWNTHSHGQHDTPKGYVVTLHDVFRLARPDLIKTLGMDAPERMLLH